jgi:hypothetical protein
LIAATVLMIISLILNHFILPKSNQVRLDFEDLGMEAIYEFDIEDMPVTVAVDSTGDSIHNSAPKIWMQKIKEVNYL